MSDMPGRLETKFRWWWVGGRAGAYPRTGAADLDAAALDGLPELGLERAGRRVEVVPDAGVARGLLMAGVAALVDRGGGNHADVRRADVVRASLAAVQRGHHDAAAAGRRHKAGARGRGRDEADEAQHGRPTRLPRLRVSSGGGPWLSPTTTDGFAASAAESWAAVDCCLDLRPVWRSIADLKFDSSVQPSGYRSP